MFDDNEARVNITWAGQNGDLPDPVSFHATNHEVIHWATEAVQAGDVPGIMRDGRANFRDFVVDRFVRNDRRPYNLIQIRPSTPFG